VASRECDGRPVSRSATKALVRDARFPRIGGLSSARATCASPTQSRAGATPRTPRSTVMIAVETLLSHAYTGHADAVTALLCDRRRHRPRARTRDRCEAMTRVWPGPRARICDGAPSSTLRGASARGHVCARTRSSPFGTAGRGGPGRPQPPLRRGRACRIGEIWLACTRADERRIQTDVARLTRSIGIDWRERIGRPHLGGAVLGLGDLSWRDRSRLAVRFRLPARWPLSAGAAAWSGGDVCCCPR
jgi:hypothetical protein